MRTTPFVLVSLAILAVTFSGFGLLVAAAASPAAIPAPRLIDLAVHGEPNGSGSTLYRLWDDGLIETNRRTCDTCSWHGWAVVSGE